MSWCLNLGSPNPNNPLAGCGKIPRLPFETLRANGTGVENIGDFPFMLSPSKHGKSLFRRLINLHPPHRLSEITESPKWLIKATSLQLRLHMKGASRVGLIYSTPDGGGFL